jgi:hypothetical protein
MYYIHSSRSCECYIEEPCAGKPQARFCGGWHDSKTLNLINEKE